MGSPHAKLGVCSGLSGNARLRYSAPFQRVLSRPPSVSAVSIDCAAASGSGRLIAAGATLQATCAIWTLSVLEQGLALRTDASIDGPLEHADAPAILSSGVLSIRSAAMERRHQGAHLSQAYSIRGARGGGCRGGNSLRCCLITEPVQCLNGCGAMWSRLGMGLPCLKRLRGCRRGGWSSGRGRPGLDSCSPQTQQAQRLRSSTLVREALADGLLLGQAVQSGRFHRRHP